MLLEKKIIHFVLQKKRNFPPSLPTGLLRVPLPSHRHDLLPGHLLEEDERAGRLLGTHGGHGRGGGQDGVRLLLLLPPLHGGGREARVDRTGENFSKKNISHESYTGFLSFFKANVLLFP